MPTYCVTCTDITVSALTKHFVCFCNKQPQSQLLPKMLRQVFLKKKSTDNLLTSAWGTWGRGEELGLEVGKGVRRGEQAMAPGSGAWVSSHSSRPLRELRARAVATSAQCASSLGPVSGFIFLSNCGFFPFT